MRVLAVARCTQWPTSLTLQCACAARRQCPVSSVGRALSRWKLATCLVRASVVVDLLIYVNCNCETDFSQIDLESSALHSISVRCLAMTCQC